MLKRRVSGPCPAGVIHAVGLGRAQRVETADLLQRGELLFDRVRDSILREQFADRAVLAFRTGTVVTEDVDDNRVVANAETVKFIDQLAGLDVDVLDETRENLHQAGLERTLCLRDAVPRRHVVGTRREFGIGRNPAKLLLTRKHPLAIDIPAVVEFAFVLVSPFLEDLVRSVRSAWRPIQEERLVRRERLVASQPVNAVLREVFAQVVFLAVRRFHRVGILEEPRLPLRRLAGDEAVEVVEAMSRRPAIEWTHRRGLVRGRIVPFSDCGGVVSVKSQHFRHRR